jgi:hypothetical protein
LEDIRVKIAEHKAGNKILSQALILTPDNTPQNILSLQSIPNSQNILLFRISPFFRTIPLLLFQNSSLPRSVPHLALSRELVQLGQNEHRPRASLIRIASRCNRLLSYLSCFRQGKQKKPGSP